MSSPDAARRPPRWSLLRLRRTLFGQISLALALLFILLGPIAYFSLKLTLGRADDLLMQLTLWKTAEEVALTVEPLLQPPQDPWLIQNTFYELHRYNPLIDFYVVRADGEIVHDFAHFSTFPSRSRIDTEPIRRFLQPEASMEAPIYGDDPDDPLGTALFSAVEVKIAGEPHYLYGVFHGRKQLRAYQVYAENYLLFQAGFGIMLCLAIVICSALLLFFVLSRRVSRLAAVVAAFRDGDYSSRSRAQAKDELGELASAFDEMADRIVASIGKLEERDALRRELIATVSHDLRGPLANIIAHLEQAEHAGKEGAESLPAGSVSAIRRNAHKLGELLSQLFELAKLEAREMVPELEEHYLAGLFDDLLISYQAKANEQQIALTYELDDPSLCVRADLTMIGRVLGNLIENALRFTASGGAITLRATAGGKKAIISITDTGSGIAESDLPKIFDKFYQTKEGRMKSLSSFGLGLAIVRRLVELHGSEIKVRSSIGVGTEFYFELPRCTVSPTS